MKKSLTYALVLLLVLSISAIAFLSLELVDKNKEIAQLKIQAEEVSHTIESFEEERSAWQTEKELIYTNLLGLKSSISETMLNLSSIDLKIQQELEKFGVLSENAEIEQLEEEPELAEDAQEAYEDNSDETELSDEEESAIQTPQATAEK